jgi:hypothetical protein
MSCKAISSYSGGEWVGKSSSPISCSASTSSGLLIAPDGALLSLRRLLSALEFARDRVRPGEGRSLSRLKTLLALRSRRW